MNKTAMQWLYDELAQCLHREEVCDLVYKLEQKAKEMEREQIVDAFNDGSEHISKIIEYILESNIATEYYLENYVNKNE